MKLEHIADGAMDTPLVRLYDFDEHDAATLRRTILELESGARNEVALHELADVRAVAGCRLTLKVGKRDEGVRSVDATAFSCVLTSEAWGRVADLIQPFCERAEPGSWQYLDDTSDITLVLSVDGGW